ncbi:hypothetical protein GA0115257_110820, partial [Streptomyces sp. LcepLS]
MDGVHGIRRRVALRRVGLTGLCPGTPLLK